MSKQRKKVLILGATGMLGHKLLRMLSDLDSLEIYATCRCRDRFFHLMKQLGEENVYSEVDAGDFGSVLRVLGEIKPDIVINCIGVIKQLAGAKDPLLCIEINSLFPHRLAKACQSIGSRLIHFSTDCVFSGNKGLYVENDFPDCDDLYGRTKLLGEVDYPNAVTLRTSIIGHELHSSVSLVDWFLGETDKVKGFKKAIYSGFTTIEMAKIIADFVIPHPELSGVYHVSSDPISKYDLLHIVKEIYGKKTEIESNNEFICDRSLDSSRFRALTGYVAPSWREMITEMYKQR